MDRILSHDEVQELLGVYAVHAVDEHDAAAISAHVSECEDCTAELDRLLDAAASFGMTELEEPSGEIWGRIQTEIRRPTVATEPNMTPAASPIASQVASPVASQVVSLDAARDRRPARHVRFRIAAFSAAAAVAVAVPTTLALSGTSTPSLAAVAARSAKQAGSRTIALRDETGQQVADAILTGTGQGYLRVSALASLPSDKTYQLWLVDNGKPVSLGLLGNAPTTTAFTSRADIDAIAISVEPRDGSTAPSQTPIAVGALT
jgi:Anti-sigma-K factor rskA